MNLISTIRWECNKLFLMWLNQKHLEHVWELLFFLATPNKLNTKYLLLIAFYIGFYMLVYDKKWLLYIDFFVEIFHSRIMFLPVVFTKKLTIREILLTVW